MNLISIIIIVNLLSQSDFPRPSSSEPEPCCSVCELPALKRAEKLTLEGRIPTSEKNGGVMQKYAEMMVDGWLMVG